MVSTGRTYRHWSEADDALLIKLHEEHGLTWANIAERLNRGEGACSSRYYMLRGGSGSMNYVGKSPIKTLAQIHAARLSPVEQRREQQRDARLAAAIARAEAELANAGCITSTFFGDPPPGYSALDRKRKDQHA